MFLSASSASALNIISLTPATAVAEVGDLISFDLSMDFDAPLQGGGIQIAFDDSLLQFSSFGFDALLADEATLRCHPGTPTPNCNETLPPNLEIGWGVFMSDPLTGPHLIGTLVLEAIGAGETLLTMTESIGFPGSFYSPDQSLIAPTLEGASISIGASAVPEPTTALLLGMGLTALSVRSRRS